MRYCIGDIHGCIKTLKYLINKIYEKDSHPEFYFVGDLIDRGPNSKAVLDFIIDLYSKGIIAKSVRGNHEEMFLNAYKNNCKISDTNWQYNGAEQTIKSFVSEPNLALKVKDLVPQRYFDFINTLPYFINLNDYYIVHAGINFNSKNPFQDFEHMLWTREEQYDEKSYSNMKIIHGHSPIPKEQIKQTIKTKNMNIDSGCVYTHIPNLGYLTAINLNTFELIIVKNIDS